MISQATPTIETIFSRRTIRELKEDSIPKSDIELLFKCMQAAPNAGNVEPWFFYAVTNNEIKKKLCQISFDQKAVEKAPVVFVICSVPENSAEKYGETGKELFCIQDTAAAVQNLLLAVDSLGYAAVWIGVIDADAISKAMDIPEGRKPVAIVPVGFAAEATPEMERKNIKKITKIIE